MCTSVSTINEYIDCKKEGFSYISKNYPLYHIYGFFHAIFSNGKLKRSAVLLFYGDPSIVQVGSFAKVGIFANGTVEYHDDLEGSLIGV